MNGPVLARDLITEAAAGWHHWQAAAGLGIAVGHEADLNGATALEALDTGTIDQVTFWAIVNRATRCGCWSCDGQCAGSADEDGCGLVQPDELGRPVCQACRELADVIDLEHAGIRVRSRVLGFDDLVVRLDPDVWGQPHNHTLWLAPASARALAARLIAAADDTEAGQ